jgi:hypothetical protein
MLCEAVTHLSLTHRQQDVPGNRCVVPLRDAQMVPLRTPADIATFSRCSKLVNLPGFTDQPPPGNGVQVLHLLVMDVYDTALPACFAK